MPEHLNRSPCTALVSGRLRESAAPTGVFALSERLAPDRGNATLREEKRDGETVTLVDVTVATAGRVNRNLRLYPREVWQAAIDAAQDDLAAGRLWGLLEHPEDTWDRWDPLKGRLENIWVLYERLWLDGDTVRATGVLVDDHAAGQTMRALLKRKVAVGISSNGTGSAQYLPAKEIPGLADFPDPEQIIAVIQPDFRLLTIDAVSDPSDLSGTARQKETHRPKEGSMNPKLKALLDRFPGLTLEQIKAQHQTEYAATMVAIAEDVTQAPSPGPTPAPQPAQNPAPSPAPAPQPAPSPAPASTHAESTLERNVLALNARLEASERQAFTEKRTNIAITALEAAQLPRAPKVGDLDLDARFREQVIQVSVAAGSEDEARQLVGQMIEERRVLMGAAATPPRGRPHESAAQRAGGVSLPIGNNSAPARQVEGHNPVANVRGSLGLR
ncbi:hypothetical protein QOL99_00210 [Deinococcus sp. MIMF12]|uniref:HK97 family phage prohead protease n=1 Tax=Deinococcus rhizophilus TaxID=3049544 RepID=A0ABT7JBZ3_9DEIO|nr:hypothetical protein [Deinococcus rhizophilus]MDL2342571.1 hypothetical protein [Deinococcus rhizophilus]